MAGHGKGRAGDPLQPEGAAPSLESSTGTSASRVSTGESTDSERQAQSQTHSEVAAFVAGRLLNRLLFHLQQHWFLLRGHRKTIEAALEELGRAVRPIVPPDQRDEFQVTVTSPIKDLLRWADASSHYDACEDHREELRKVDDEFDFFEYRKRLLKPVFEAILAVQRAIELKLDERALLSFRLGQLVDQGARPSDVYRHLYQPKASRRIGGPTTAPGPIKLSREWLREHAQPEPEEPENYLANRTVRPGDEPPDFDWHAEVEQRLIEMGNLGLLIPCVQQLLKLDHGGCLNEVVQQVEDAVIGALVAPASPEDERIAQDADDPEQVIPIRDEQTEARDKWIFDEWSKGTAYKLISSELKKKTKWEHIDSDSGILAAAKRYAERHRLLPPPPRRRKTNRKRTD